jgi:hypothetical protein
MIKISSKKSKKILISTVKNQFLGICIIIIIIIIIYCTPTHAIITWWKWLPNVQPTTTFRCNKYDMKLPYVMFMLVVVVFYFWVEAIMIPASLSRLSVPCVPRHMEKNTKGGCSNSNSKRMWRACVYRQWWQHHW